MNNYLIPANSKKSQLIFNVFRIIINFKFYTLLFTFEVPNI